MEQPGTLRWGCSATAKHLVELNKSQALLLNAWIALCLHHTGAE